MIRGVVGRLVGGCGDGNWEGARFVLALYILVFAYLLQCVVPVLLYCHSVILSCNSFLVVVTKLSDGNSTKVRP